MLSVLDSSIYYRMQTYGLSSLDFSDISYKDLDYQKADSSKDFPFCGEGMMKLLPSTKRH